MTIDIDIRREVERVLSQHGLAMDGLTVSDGFANVVLLTERPVVRLNSGRFSGAFAHEANVLTRLPGNVPHPQPIAHGLRQAGGEYLILERLPGVNLDTAWSGMSEADRRMVALELGETIRALHALPVATWMANPWVANALEIGAWGDAYHAPPAHFRAMVESAVTSRPDLRSLLNNVARFIAERLAAFEPEPSVFTHTDLHFRNVILDGGHVTGLIDFEGSRLGPPDIELDMLLRSMTFQVHEDANRRSRILGPMAEVYPALFGRPDLTLRLEVQEAQWHLVQLHHWQPGQRWMDDPGELLRQLLDGAFRERTSALLEDASRR